MIGHPDRSTVNRWLL